MATYCFDSDRQALFGTPRTSWANLDRSLLWRVYGSEVKRCSTTFPSHRGPIYLEPGATAKVIADWLQVRML